VRLTHDLYDLRVTIYYSAIALRYLQSHANVTLLNKKGGAENFSFSSSTLRGSEFRVSPRVSVCCSYDCRHLVGVVCVCVIVLPSSCPGKHSISERVVHPSKRNSVTELSSWLFGNVSVVTSSSFRRDLEARPSPERMLLRITTSSRSSIGIGIGLGLGVVVCTSTRALMLSSFKHI
jgi:hypothetical protein